MHGKFCNTCNRIRLTSTGDLKPCLCYGDIYPLKELLKSGTDDEIREQIKHAMRISRRHIVLKSRGRLQKHIRWHKLEDKNRMDQKKGVVRGICISKKKRNCQVSGRVCQDRTGLGNRRRCTRREMAQTDQPPCTGED